ncbi:MAG: D-alanine--D-alanine ligase [Sulfurospirillaceae bacterium]|nr:D-alanine--D-alanine ligase [Sulfurospirillaceae bacterium]
MKIGILFGAKSFEHEISVVSAIALKKVLKCEIVYLFCDYERDFYLIPTDKINAKRFSSGEYKKDTKLHVDKGGFYKKGLFGNTMIECDVVLNLIHGGDGEDGKIASILEFFGIPFIGPRVEASVMSFNKLLTKLYAKEMGVKTLEYQVVSKNRRDTLTINPPFIVKPSRLGSSIGIKIVKDLGELDYALDVAFEFDNTVIVEPFIAGVKEYNLAGCKTDDFIFSIVEEPIKEEFLDFDKKYLDFSRTKRVNEASLDEKLVLKLQDSFKKLYEPMFAGALIRCDFFIIDNEVYLNEINPIPGSMANYLFSDFNAVIEILCKHLPLAVNVPMSYRYINSIQSAKGK